jgi:hypothetical protein
MTESDIADLAGYFLSSFGIGFVSGFILRVFRRGAEATR